MKLLFLYNKKKTAQKDETEVSESHWYGMKELQRIGVDSNFSEVEKEFPLVISNFFRKRLNIHLIHIPLLPFVLKYDIIISSTALGLLSIKSLLGFKKPKWIMLSFNTSYELENRRGWKGVVYRWATKKADGIIAISAQEAENLKKRFPNKKITFFPFGIDPSEFTNDGLQKKEKYILSVGRDPGRDYETLIKAVENIDIDLYVTAKPSQLKKLSPLPANVHVRNFSKIELIDAYQKALLVVIPLNPKKGSADSMGCSSLLESMSMGKTTIVTDTAHIRSYIRNNHNGVLFTQNDPKDLQKKILELMSNSEKNNEIGRNARTSILAEFNLRRFAENIRDFSEEVFRN